MPLCYQTTCVMKITNNSQIPSKWRENFINCRNCKRKLVIFLTNYFLHTSGNKMPQGKVLLTAGGFCGSIEDTPWAVSSGRLPYPNPQYTCNCEETDTRMWLHVKQTQHSVVDPGFTKRGGGGGIKSWMLVVFTTTPLYNH